MEFARRNPKTNVLCGIIAFLVAWIALMHMYGSGELTRSSREQSFSPQPDQTYGSSGWRIRAEEQPHGGNCSTRDGHFLDDIGAAENAWSQMKWIGQPAPCPVRGELIERLDDVNNFRRGFSLRFSGNVEDRIHILPWLLGSKIDLNQRKRRVYLDLGSNSFSSSLLWFLRMYPTDFTEIHAFESLKDVLIIPQPFDEMKNRAPENPNSAMTKGKPGIPGWMLKRIKVYNKYVADEDDVETEKVNITRFIKQDLKLKAEDAVIVKMDIEGSEWPVLTRWLNDPEMAQIVDEIFVEVHYNHPSMYNFNWHRFGKPRSAAKRLLADLRWKGFYAHFWP